MPHPTADVAVIGGSGFYAFLDLPVVASCATPFGEPSAPVTVGEVDGRPVAFLPRHGTRHQWAPHLINYRANLWALRELGVRRVVGPCAAGSLRPDVHPGDFMILDQLVDRTSGRPDTYIDTPVVEHVSFADPYCRDLSASLAQAGAAVPGVSVHPSGTVVVVNGPRFSTRAESRSYRAAGWDVINMTQYPEAYLARELGLCYAGLALVTDYDTGVEVGATAEGRSGPPGGGAATPVTMDAVMAVLDANVTRTRELLFAALPRIAADQACGCATAGAASLAR